MVGRGWTLLQLIIVVLVPFYYCAPFLIFLLACAIFMENQHMLWRVNKKNRWRRKHLLLYNFFVNPICPLYFSSPLLVDEFQTKLRKRKRCQGVQGFNVSFHGTSIPIAPCVFYIIWKKQACCLGMDYGFNPLQMSMSDTHDDWASSQLFLMIFLMTNERAAS